MQQLSKPSTGYKFVKGLFKQIFEIPEEWEYPKFSHVVEVNPRTKINSQKCLYVPMEAVNIDSGSVDHFEERNVDENPSLPKFQKNDILFARITPSTENGKVCIIQDHPEEGIASSELTVLRPNSWVVPRYLYYFVQSHRVKQYAISQMMGTTGRQRVPDIVFKHDLNFELPPVNEQSKIISYISKVDELIQKTDQVIEQTQRLKKGLMQKLLTKGIGHTKYERTEQGEIPQNWEIKDLREFSVTYRYPTFYDIEYCSDGIPVLNIGNIDNHTWKLSTNLKDYQKIDKKTSDLFNKTIVEEGDLVLAVRGATIGKFALVPHGLTSSNINANLLRIHLNKEICDPTYFWYYTQTRHGRSEFKKFVSYTAKETVQAGRLKFWKIILPKIDEQRKIRSILNYTEATIENGLEYKDHVQNLKKGLMQKLLTGKIRVKV